MGDETRLDLTWVSPQVNHGVAFTRDALIYAFQDWDITTGKFGLSACIAEHSRNFTAREACDAAATRLLTYARQRGLVSYDMKKQEWEYVRNE